ncbi:MAG: RDD family protein [Thermogutta sp.]
MNRRQLAFFVDIVFFTLIVLFIKFAGRFVVGFLVAYTSGEVTEEELATIEGMFTLFNYGLYFFWYLLKDGFRGASLGKALTGIRVIDDTTGAPIGFRKSANRNWPIVLLGLVPFAWLIIGATMGKGYRIGDRGAKTKVIWKKYEQSPIFQPKHRATTAASALMV